MAVRIAYNATGQRVGEHHQRAKWPEALIREILTDYDVHAIYPVDIARDRGVPYQTVKHIVYRRRRNVPVDHYIEVPDGEQG